ncbi:MAG: SGNH/GDSL hydrolase family protein [Methylococcales bacterium]
MKKTLISCVVCLVLFGSSNPTWAQPFNNIYAFGDSLSDGGNSSTAVLSIYKLINGCDVNHPCPPYFDGHFSNGYSAIEHLANNILPGGAKDSNFKNYAVAGATTGIGNFGDQGNSTSTGLFGLPGMSQEIGLYLSTSFGSADPNALYFVWGGANDFLTNNSPIAAAQNISQYVYALANAGAKHIFVPNLPDLSLTPFVRSISQEPLAQAFSVLFNSELNTRLNQLSAQTLSTHIIQFDTFSFINNVAQHPDQYGFTDIQNACLSSNLTVCAHPEQTIYWDDFHPTSYANSVIAQAFSQAIPEPAVVLLIILGLFIMSKFLNRQINSL